MKRCPREYGKRGKFNPDAASGPLDFLLRTGGFLYIIGLVCPGAENMPISIRRYFYGT
jgi:hypothetical protein